MANTQTNCSTDCNIEYIEKMCYEFSKLLYDLSEEHNRTCEQWAKKCEVLEARCAEYEAQLLRPQGDTPAAPKVSLLTRIKICLRRAIAAAKARIKRPLKRIAGVVFRFGRKAVTRLGIKDRLKNTRIFRNLYRKGIIEKLRQGGHLL